MKRLMAVTAAACITVANIAAVFPVQAEPDYSDTDYWEEKCTGQVASGDRAACNAYAEYVNSQRSSLESRLNEIESQRAAIKADLETYAAQISGYQTQIDDLQVQINSKQAEIDAKQAEIDAKQVEIDNKQIEIDNKQKEIDAKQAEIDSEEIAAIYATEPGEELRPLEEDVARLFSFLYEAKMDNPDVLELDESLSKVKQLMRRLDLRPVPYGPDNRRYFRVETADYPSQMRYPAVLRGSSGELLLPGAYVERSAGKEAI